MLNHLITAQMQPTTQYHSFIIVQLNIQPLHYIIIIIFIFIIIIIYYDLHYWYKLHT